MNAPDPSRIVGVARRASDYARSAVLNCSGTSERAQVEALALAYLCSRVDPTAKTRAAFHALVDAVNEPNWLAADLCTSLVAVAGAVAHRAPFAASGQTYIRLLVEMADESGSAVNRALVDLMVERQAVSSPFAPPKLTTGLNFSAALQAGVVETALAEIEAKSRFGAASLDIEPALPALLEGGALAAFRSYDLILGMRYLRARRYVSPTWSFGLGQGVDFVLSSEDQGRFGDYDTAIAKLVADGRQDAEALLHLPVTFQAVWTLAEWLDPDFRLGAIIAPDPKLVIAA